MIKINGAARINRGLRRRINRGKPLDSFPYLSGDSYFFSCEFYFKEGRLIDVPVKPNRSQKKSSIFVNVNLIEEFIEFLKSNSGLDLSKYSITLHNGDNSISLQSLDYLVGRFNRIYGVNIMNVGESIFPIPIGLENFSYFTNGVPADFDKIVKSGLTPSENRGTLILDSFNLLTNKTERETCSKIGLKLGSKKLEMTTPLEYRKAVTGSKFVLSPPGNGLDCHRTWEALYLGAIPIVKRASWPFAHLQLPVLVINEWEDLFSIDLNSFSVKDNSSWSKNFWDAFFYEK